MSFRFLTASIAALGLSACAGPVADLPKADAFALGAETDYQKQLAFTQLMKDKDRLFNVAFPILADNAEFCLETEPRTGFTVWSSYSVGPKYRDAAKAAYNLHGRLALQSVADRSPAGRAGLQSGDIVLSVNGEEVPTSPGAHKQVGKVVTEAGLAPFPMTVERAGRKIDVTITPVLSCSYTLHFIPDDEKNAFADGKGIYMHKGMMRFAQSDDELATVLGHEMAHNVMRHVDKGTRNRFLGLLGGALVDAVLGEAAQVDTTFFRNEGLRLGDLHNSIPFEKEADYVGLYYTARAGYDISKAAPFWRRMAAERIIGEDPGQTHPDDPERFVTLELARQEIEGKKARGEPLVPNLAKTER